MNVLRSVVIARCVYNISIEIAEWENYPRKYFFHFSLNFKAVRKLDNEQITCVIMF